VLIRYRVRSNFWSLLETGSASWHDNSERELLRSVLMTTCDIAAISKPWSVQLRAANLVLTEFFEQGDKERHQLNIQPQVTQHRVLASFAFLPTLLLFPSGPSNHPSKGFGSAVSSLIAGENICSHQTRSLGSKYIKMRLRPSPGFNTLARYRARTTLYVV